ncbi:MAG: acyl-CoA thioesterase [Pseudomonadota bacterium]
MITASVRYEVPFYDVDTYRIVYHGNYPKYFELARCKLLETIGYSYAEMEASGFLFPVIEMQIKYVHPLLFRQVVDIEARLVSWENKLVFRYLISDAEAHTRLTKGMTSQVAISMPERITQFKSPDVLRNAVKHHLESVA